MESVSPAFLRCVIMPVSGRKWKSDSLAAGRRPMCSRWAGDPRPGPSTFAVPNAVGGGGGAAGGMPAAGTGPVESISGKNTIYIGRCGVIASGQTHAEFSAGKSTIGSSPCPVSTGVSKKEERLNVRDNPLLWGEESEVRGL